MSFLTASSRRLAAAAAVVASFGLAGSAVAGNDVTFDLSVNGGPNQNFANPGTDVGNDVFNYQEFVFGPGYTVSWDINAKGFDSPFISGNIVVVNQSLETQTFEFLVTLPISVALLPSSLMGGSVAGGLTTDLNGGALSALPGTAVWQAFIDGNQVQTLLNAPFAVSKFGAGSVGIGPESFGTPIPSMPGPAITDTMQIKISFSLTAGDQASFTSVFTAVPIPAPAALALVGVAGLVGSRRRRN